ncbi:MAG: AsmA family protein, partial [Gammaproteobacteria bacterium]|nr:AsmA family protein [Gammaproteobacteria bacterium]
MTLLSLILRRLIIFIILLASIVGILNYANISFKSNTAHQLLLEGLKTFTGRNVSIDGDAHITISIPPKLLVERIHIRNIDGFNSEDFVTVNEVRVEIPLRQLLRGALRLEEFSADHAKINLIQNKEGKNNWTFDHVTSLTKTPDDSGDSLRQSDTPLRLSLGLFRLTDVSIHYEDQSRGHIIEKHIEHLEINIKDITKPRAEIIGSMQGSPYSISLETGPLHSLTSGQPWLVNGSGNIAGSLTSIDASLQVIDDVIDGHVNINVESVNLGLTLEKLGFIAGQDVAAEKVNIKAKL